MKLSSGNNVTLKKSLNSYRHLLLFSSTFKEILVVFATVCSHRVFFSSSLAVFSLMFVCEYVMLMFTAVCLPLRCTVKSCMNRFRAEMCFNLHLIS